MDILNRHLHALLAQHLKNVQRQVNSYARKSPSRSTVLGIGWLSSIKDGKWRGSNRRIHLHDEEVKN